MLEFAGAGLHRLLVEVNDIEQQALRKPMTAYDAGGAFFSCRREIQALPSASDPGTPARYRDGSRRVELEWFSCQIGLRRYALLAEGPKVL